MHEESLAGIKLGSKWLKELLEYSAAPKEEGLKNE
jgi:hypothetical protein